MKKGEILIGVIVSFFYILAKSGENFCMPNIKDADAQVYTVLLGKQSEYSFGTMMQLKGQGVEITATCSEIKDKKARFSDVSFNL